MEVLIFIMALLVSFPGKTNRAIKSLTALLVFPGIWQGHYGNNGPAILLIELALLCNYDHNAHPRAVIMVYNHPVSRGIIGLMSGRDIFNLWNFWKFYWK